jgi:RHS repeat-associated protein
MAGISSKAAGKLENKYKYNGNELQSSEFSDRSGLDWYDFDARTNFHQFGRFGQIDPIADKFPWQSPYASMDNNPILKTDKNGRAASPIYDEGGNLLGTDDQGLQGKAIVMNKDNFKQGMAHDDAVKNNLWIFHPIVYHSFHSIVYQRFTPKFTTRSYG